ncbi:MAG: UDP-N-acetylmuramoyl-tripeptide--D-alanyl-D-alanine ligase [bacterium]
MNWTISDILASEGFSAQFSGKKKRLKQDIHSIKIDSRKVADGDIFVAVKGERFDAHDFLDDVFANGALAAVVNTSWWRKHQSEMPDCAFLIVNDTLDALQKIARAYRRLLSPKIIALTGSNGKTTTKEMIANVLAMKYKFHKTEGNLNNHIGVPLTLLAMKPGVELAVVEMGTNHFGEIEKLCEIAEPDLGVITNIGKAHTEFLQDIDGVRRAKGELFEAIAETGAACVNIDDPNVVQAARDAKPRKEITYGFNAAADIRGENLHLGDDGCARFECENMKFRVGVPGLHNAGNALAVLALVRYFEIDFEIAQQKLNEPVAVSGRMRKLKIGGRIVIDDAYNANPESVRAAFEFLSAFLCAGARIAVLGDMLELGEQAIEDHRAVLEYGLAHDNIECIMVHGKLMSAAFKKLDGKRDRLIFFAEKSRIAHHLMKTTKSGDAILIKGSRGAKMEDVLAEFEKMV